MFAIVDIETTGGSATKSRITEIAIFLHDGKKVVEEYQTLINPSQEIPHKITQLTGISGETVKDAPLFREVANKIDAFIGDAVFVAHNVNFDYNFVKAEFDRLGIAFRRKKLCTVRLSRKLLPGKFSYSLGRLCASENIPLSNRHRAAGDAKATAILFSKLLKLDNKDIIKNSLNPQSLEALIPPNVQKSDYMALPEEQGIYYFLNQKKQIIYIGKAKNLKQRVQSHFSGNTNTKSKYYFVNNIYGIDFKLIKSDLLVNLIEAMEIKKYWPIHNRSMKRISLNYGLFLYEDRNGYQRFTIGRCGKHDKPLKSFKNQSELKSFLREIVEAYELCPRLAGLQPMASGKCNYIENFDCAGACEGIEATKSYNKRVQKAIVEQVKTEASYFLLDPVKNNTELGVALVERGRFKAYGNFSVDKNLELVEKVKEEMVAVYDDQDLSYLVHQFYRKASTSQVKYISEN
ncbi:MAG: exonuclease domain-containing protein [Vicingaceae bacterium]